MKKPLIVILSITIVITSIVFVMLKNGEQAEKDIANFNSKFESYLDQEFYGVEVATLISKAIDNNERNGIEKNEKGMYIPDDKYSIKIYINLLGSGDTYEMESIDKIGMSEFISNFNSIFFTCYKISYHEQTRRISEMYISEVDVFEEI